MLYEYYNLIKALHIIAVISWMCGALYLPRLFVYHTMVKPGSEQYKIFLTMEHKLIKIIMTPSMIASFILGILLLYCLGSAVKYMLWLHIKLLLVLIMAGLHGMMILYHKAFKNNKNYKSERYFRIFNEMPALLMITIVLLAVLKPF